jgi:hypothetical protein
VPAAVFRFLSSRKCVAPCQKDDDYESLMKRNICTEQFQEIDKCVLVCTICHKRLEATKWYGTLAITVRAGNRVFQQRVTAQAYVDKKGRMALFTSERIFVAPYWIIVGKHKPILVSGNVIRNNLNRFLLATRRRGSS